MKKFILTSLAVIFTAVVLFSFSSCESKSGKRVKEIKKEKELKNDTLIFSPEKVRVTQLEERFTPYPLYDGGTGFQVSFTLGVEYKKTIFELLISENKFFRENLSQKEAKEQLGFKNIIESYDILKNTLEKYLEIVVVKDEILKITRKAAFPPIYKGGDGNLADEFYPKKIIWEKK